MRVVPRVTHRVSRVQDGKFPTSGYRDELCSDPLHPSTCQLVENCQCTHRKTD